MHFAGFGAIGFLATAPVTAISSMESSESLNRGRQLSKYAVHLLSYQAPPSAAFTYAIRLTYRTLRTRLKLHITHNRSQMTRKDCTAHINNMCSMTTGPTSFHSFMKLPQELRDAIWRECLPRRVLEIDWPDDYFLLDVPTECDTDSEDEGPRSRLPKLFQDCRMRRTTMINAKPPIITRVCRESRDIALETGTMLEHRALPRGHNGADLDGRVRHQWFDRARDVVHLHYNTEKDKYLGMLTARGNPIRLLRDAVPLGRIGPIGSGFLFHHDKPDGRESRDILEGMKKVMVCLKVVCIHVDAEPAIQSGLFGRLGEERVIMVDVHDDERVDQSRDLWKEHGSAPDSITDDFFSPDSGS